MAKHFGIAHTHGECCCDLRSSFGVASVHVKSPGIGVEREHVVPPGVFRLGNLQGFCRQVGMVSVIKNQFAVGVVWANAL